MKVAAAVSERALDRKLRKEEKSAAGPIVHYAFGSTMGAVYGAAAEMIPATARGWGMPFGTALWFSADEVAVPSLGLSRSPTETPLSSHASALAAHLVYGLAAESVRRAVRGAL
jgi:putative membrane protein